MSLDSIIRNGVKTINKTTKSLQPVVQISAWIGSTYKGADSYASPIEVQALVIQKQELRRTASGEMVMTKAYVAFIQPVPPNGAVGRVEPIDPRDKIVLPDGTTGRIVNTDGLIDPAISRPYLSEVWLA